MFVRVKTGVVNFPSLISRCRMSWTDEEQCIGEVLHAGASREYIRPTAARDKELKK